MVNENESIMNNHFVYIQRTTNSDINFRTLIAKLDDELNDVHDQQRQVYDQYNQVDLIQTVVVAYNKNLPVGCGCFKSFDYNTAEIKRMYVLPEFRGKGISKLILNELETWAKESGFTKAVLETGIKLPTAISLYKTHGYTRIKNYGVYKDLGDSICFEKLLTS